MEIFGYVFYFGGIFLAPGFFFIDYKKFIEGKNIRSGQKSNRGINGVVTNENNGVKSYINNNKLKKEYNGVSSNGHICVSSAGRNGVLLSNGHSGVSSNGHNRALSNGHIGVLSNGRNKGAIFKGHTGLLPNENNNFLWNGDIVSSNEQNQVIVSFLSQFLYLITITKVCIAKWTALRDL